MEKKVVDIKEALTFMFKKDNILNLLASLLYYVPLVFLVPIVTTMINSNEISPLAVVGVVLFGILAIPCFILFQGYITIYMHDRALDKNAVLRNPFTCILDSFFVWLKAAAGANIVKTVLFTVFAICILIVALLCVIPYGIIIAVPLIIILVVAYVVLSFLFMFKLIPNFAKDLKFVSYLNVVEAFKLTKGVRYGLVIGVYILLYLIAVVALLISVGIVALFIAFKVNPFIPTLIVGMFSIFYFAYVGLFGINMFGQHAYNAIEQNRGVEPETLPKEINKDTTGIIFAAIALVLLTLFSLLLNIIKVAVNAPSFSQRISQASAAPSYSSPKQKAAPSIFSLSERQAQMAALTKVKKSVSSYEIFAKAYMSQKNTKSLSNLTYNNCEQLSEYFKIVEDNGCSFTTADGVYWQFNYDGSANISDNKNDPKVLVNVGVCSDGTVNCESEYPEVTDLLYNRI